MKLSGVSLHVPVFRNWYNIYLKMVSRCVSLGKLLPVKLLWPDRPGPAVMHPGKGPAS